MNKLFLTLFLSFSVLPAFSQTELRKEIVELAVGADVIVRGTVTEVKGGYFTLNVDKMLVGPDEQKLEVNRYRNSKTAKRWGKYTVDEQVLLFLKLNDDRYDILGVNGEGEKLVHDQQIYLDSRGGSATGKYTYTNISPDLNYYAEQAPLADFEETIPGLRACFEVQYTEVENRTEEIELRPTGKLKCDADVLEPLRGKSETARNLVEKAEELAQ